MSSAINAVRAVFRRIRAIAFVAFLKTVYGSRIGFKGLPILGGKIYISIFLSGKVRIGKALSVRRGFEIRSTGLVEIGDGCFFNNYCTLTALDRITIGNDCIFGERVSVFDHDHGFRKKGELFKNQDYTVRDVSIGNNVWVGSNVTILKGVHIGDNCVIGANCVVYKDVPANTLVKMKTTYDFVGI